MRASILFLVFLLGGCSSVAATSSSKHPSSAPASTGTAVGVEVVFSEDEIKVIRAYYQSHTSGRGKGKYKGLPPGIAKNLRRGKPLPPGIAKQTLPYDLRHELPPAPKGHERIVVAGKILLVEIATQIVRDVLTDVVFS